MPKMNQTQRQLAKQLFDKWFSGNYPGPTTIISDPHWHAPKIFAAVESCVEEALANTHAHPG